MLNLVKRSVRAAKRRCGLATGPVGEIRGDSFAEAIVRIAGQEDVSTILEIGSSIGAGSTDAFVNGIRANPRHPTLFCMEVSSDRCLRLKSRYLNDEFVKCYNCSSVPAKDFAMESEVRGFLDMSWSPKFRKSADQWLSWLRIELDYLAKSGVPTNGIQRIKAENKIDFFDVVLIDGSEFTARAELEQTYGAKFILLDDIHAFKNHWNWMRLIADRNYRPIASDPTLRGGFAIFQRIADN